MDANQFTQKSIEAINLAQQTAREYGNPQVEQLHLLYALLQDEQGLIPQLFAKMNLQPRTALEQCRTAISRLSKMTGGSLYAAPDLEQIFTEAQNQRQRMGDDYVSVEHLFLALLERGNNTVRELFARMNVDKKAFLTALQAVRGNTRVTTDSPEDTYDVLKKYDIIGNTIVSSFDAPLIKRLKQLHPDVYTCLLYNKRRSPAAYAQSLGCSAIHPYHKNLKKVTVENAHKRGLKVNCWTANEEADIRHMIEIGCDGIITNYPDRAIRIAEEE